MSSSSLMHRVSQLVIFGASIITIVVSPWTNFDSINLPKLLITSSIGFSLFGILLASRTRVVDYLEKPLLVSILIFLLFLTLPLLFTAAPLNQQFWGMFGRGNGWLSYFSSLVFFVASTMLIRRSDYVKLINVFVGTAVILTVYAVIQYIGQDPVPWSQKMVFATLGNINFLSAFFGLTSLAAVSLALTPKISNPVRFSLFMLVSLDMFLVYTTKSIQGIMLFFGGLVFVLFFKFRVHPFFLRLKYLYFSLISVVFILVITGLTNKGPLASLVFAPSVLFRADYWHAGWKISLAHPVFGVGLDSYGDYYREFRGLISTTRTIPERTANTAHNIFLDLSSGGGFPLLFAYLALLSLSIRACIKVHRRNQVYDPIFTSICAVLVGYQIQAFVSIAQIGVSIWGWVFMGAAIGYERVTRGQSTEALKFSKSPGSFARRKMSEKPQLLAPGVALVGILGFAVGFVIAIPPLTTDAAFRKAFQVGNLAGMSEAVNRQGSSAYLIGLSLEFAAKNGNQVLGEPLNKLLNEKYPRDMYGWRVKYAKPWATAEEKLIAIKKMRELDPFNPEIPAS
jgi:O-antigen ligase